MNQKRLITYRYLLQECAFLGLLIVLTSACGKTDHKGPLHYRLEKTPERWILRDPQDQPFIILSVNHAHTLENPKYDSLVVANFGGPEEAGRRFAELIRAGEFNAAGYKPYYTMTDFIPFVHGEHFVKCNFWRSAGDFEYADVFAPEWQSHADSLVRENVARVGDHPNLIGYVFTDTPRWGLDKARKTRGTDWVSFIRSLAGTAPGKQAYVFFLRERYGNDPEGLSALYGIGTTEQESLLRHGFEALDPEVPGLRADDLDFLRLIARTYYQTIAGAYRRYDPDRLLLGDKYKLYDHPDVVLEEAVKWIDVLSFQPGQGSYGMPRTVNDAPKTENDFAHLLELDRIHERFGKPIYICDHHLSFHTDEYPETLWYQYPDVASQATAYEVYLKQAFERPYIIGYGRCQFHTTFIRGIAKQGIINSEGEPFSDHLKKVSSINQAVLEQIYNSVD